MLKGKTVLLGVTGGIAAYKAAALASALVKLHASVEVIMTEHATKFIAPLTFEQLTGNRTMVDTFDRNFSHQVEHISLAQRTDLVLIAPATANVCAKLAHGLADDMLTTTVLACRCPKLVAPAMNTNMFENPVTRIIWRSSAAMVGKSSRPLPAVWPAARWVQARCLSLRPWFSTSCARSHSPMTWPARKFWSPPAPPRSLWIPCAI